MTEHRLFVHYNNMYLGVLPYPDFTLAVVSVINGQAFFVGERNLSRCLERGH
jgi:hypothetical protein